MSFLAETDALRSFINEVAADEGLELYDAERLNRGSLRLWVVPKVGAVRSQLAGTDEVSSESSDSLAESFSDELQNADSIEVETEVTSSGVTVGECSRLCRRLMVVFQAEGGRFGLPTEPEIEVSSPGVNRALRLPEHFAGAVGERVKMTVERRQDEKRAEGNSNDPSNRRICTVVGVLERFDSGALDVRSESNGEILTCGLLDVKRAQVDFKFPDTSRR